MSFRLRQRILWSESEFLGFDNTEDLPTHTKGMIGGSSISRVFLNGDAVARAERSVRIKRKYFPLGSLELWVEQIGSCIPPWSVSSARISPFEQWERELRRPSQCAFRIRL